MTENDNLFSNQSQITDVAEVLSSYRRGVPTTAFGVSFGAKCHILSQMDGKILFVVKDFLEAEKTYKQLSSLTEKSVAVLYEREELLLTSRARSKDTKFNRIKGIIKAQTGADIIVATLPSILGLYPTNLGILTLKKGEEYDINLLEQALVELGYKKGDLTSGTGTFARRGDIFDIHPIGEQNPVRLDFFGDEVERIKVFEEGSSKSLTNLDSVLVMPATEMFLSEEDIKEVSSLIDGELKSYTGKKNERFKEFAEEVKANLAVRNFSATVSLLPLIKHFKTIDNAFDFDTVVYSEPRSLYGVLDAYYAEHKERFNALYASGEVFSADLYQLCDPADLIENLKAKKQVAFQTLTADIKFFNPLKIVNLKTAPAPKYLGKYKDLFADLRGWVDGDYRVKIYAGDTERRDKIKEDIALEGLPLGAQISVTEKPLPEGFILHGEKQVVIGSDDIYLKPKNTSLKSTKKTKPFFSAPIAGDYAVHEIHGIGKVLGNKKLTTGLGTKDYVAVSYRGGDILYVPVEHLDALTRYVGGEKEPQLSKIGGKDFARIKDRVRESLKKLSFDLKALYEERSRKNGYVFTEDDMQDLFEYSFGYEDTPDQITANREIMEDMCSKKVMDRLVCGDVGFGKTEVALRAVFRAVTNGKQAVMLAPTTILAEQHYNTAKNRFENFAITVESLDRFKTKKQQTEILQRLAEGKIDFIVGTHRLLSQDVKFKDLGLLVLDEEQRFGVEHKEKIKLLKNNVDAITLTATPIPRTLHMSLTGIRDISTINTAPKERLPVQTYVTEETDALLQDAIRRELSRGGQVFILFNRVERIYHFAEKVKELCPDAKLTVAHGQMDERTLENNVSEFFRGDSDVLIATTIIENGIDLPKANTIIVIDADMLGLSTLYQLRGRVGRSNRLAHAYFTFKREKVLTDTAYKRLSALMEFTEMGSGFKIAMRDLEIRGAGDILGANQHGHLEKVGYELYSKLLKEELDGKAEEKYIDLDVKLGAYIPDNYIENSTGRMDAYKQIAEISSSAEADEILSSLTEVYGNPPSETVNLIKIALAKRMLLDIDANKFYMDGDKAIFGFQNLKALENKNLLDAISYTKNASISMANGIGVKMDLAGLSQSDALDKVVNFLTLAQGASDIFAQNADS